MEMLVDTVYIIWQYSKGEEASIYMIYRDYEKAKAVAQNQNEIMVKNNIQCEFWVQSRGLF